MTLPPPEGRGLLKAWVLSGATPVRRVASELARFQTTKARAQATTAHRPLSRTHGVSPRDAILGRVADTLCDSVRGISLVPRTSARACSPHRRCRDAPRIHIRGSAKPPRSRRRSGISIVSLSDDGDNHTWDIAKHPRSEAEGTGSWCSVHSR